MLTVYRRRHSLLIATSAKQKAEPTHPESLCLAEHHPLGKVKSGKLCVAGKSFLRPLTDSLSQMRRRSHAY